MVSRIRRRLDLFRLLRTTDLNALERARLHYADKSQQDFNSKYWDFKKQLSKNIYRAHLLDLHRSRGLNVLDLGTGTGYFPLVCRFYGHRAIGMDLDDQGSDSMYRRVTQILGVERRLWRIDTYAPLPPFDVKFDVVTAFAALFNKPQGPNRWGVSEWRFLLQDLARHCLTQDGRIFLALVQDADGRYYDSDLKTFFVSAGAQVCRRNIYFKSISGLRQP